MANTIKPKSRSLDATPPTTATLFDGEIAVNSFSRRIFQRVGTEVIVLANYFSGAFADLSGKPATLAGYGITDAQSKDDTLTALAGLSTVANRIPYFTGTDVAGLLTWSTDGTLATDSDTTISSQRAIKTYIDGRIAAADAMVFKGVIDCSTNPNYPAADMGWTYRAGVAGKIGGASGPNVEVGDILICLTDGTTAGDHGTVGSNWSIIQANIDGALTTASIGSTVQAYDVGLTNLAGVTATANKGLYTTGVDVFATYDLSAGGRALANAAGTANTFPYFSASNVVTLQSITAAGRALLDAANNIAQRATLGLGTAATSAATAFAPAIHTHPYSNLTGTVPTWNQSTTGTAATATKLATARTINGVAFDGTANITITAAADWNTLAGKPTIFAASGMTLAAGDVPTLNQNTTGSAATLTTARTLTLGATGKAFNGSANVAWTLGEIGAAAASHTHAWGDITSGRPTTLAGYGITDGAPAASPTFTGIVGGITKAMVGLSDVDNTTDSAKPVSTAQAAAIATKQDFRAPLNGTASLVTDWNEATDNGWYMASAALNAPHTGWNIGTVTRHTSSWITQEVWDFTTGSSPIRYRRAMLAGVWQPWTTEQNFGRVQATGVVRATGLADGSATGFTGPGLEMFWNPTSVLSRVLSYNRSTGIYQPLVVAGSSVFLSPQGTDRVVAQNDSEGALVVAGRGWLQQTEGTPGFWHSDSTQTKKFFVGLENDSSWGMYNKTNSWCVTWDLKGCMYVQNANSGVRTRQPRVFVGATDPGAAAATDDLWIT